MHTVLPALRARGSACRFFQLETEGIVEKGPPREHPRSRRRRLGNRHRAGYSSEGSDDDAEDGYDDEDMQEELEESDQEAMVEGPDGMLRPNLQFRRRGVSNRPSPSLRNPFEASLPHMKITR